MRLAGLLHRTLKQVCSEGLGLREDACVCMPCRGRGLRSRGRLSLVHGGALGREVGCQVADGSCDIRVTELPAGRHQIELRLQQGRRRNVP